VVSLETAAGLVWSLAGPQPYPNIRRAPVGSTAWTNLGPTPDRSATLTVHGDVAYVVGQQGAGPIAPSLDVFTGTQPVRHEALPCGQPQTYVPFAALGTSTDGQVYLVCDVMNNQSPTQLAYQSGHQGGSWTAASPPPPQPPQGVTAVAGGRFAWNSGPDLYQLTGSGWHVSLTDPGHGFSLVGFETDTQGVALGTNGYLWITRNAGTSWSRLTVAPLHTQPEEPACPRAGLLDPPPEPASKSGKRFRRPGPAPEEPEQGDRSWAGYLAPVTWSH
jgi:hypothetical protein